MKTGSARFALPSRILPWLMAPMVIAQMIIGVTMIASLAYYPLLLAIHRPLGVLILIFAVNLGWLPSLGTGSPFSVRTTLWATPFRNSTPARSLPEAQ